MSAKTPKWSHLLSPASWVNQVAISDDASRVIGGTFIHDYEAGTRGANRQGVYCVSSYDGDGNFLWSNSFAGWDGYFAVAISGDGTMAAGGGWAGPGRGVFQVYVNKFGGIKLDVTTIPSRVNGIAFSRNGRVVTAAADGVYVYVQDGAGFYQPQTNAGAEAALKTFFGGNVTAVAIHPDGTWLAACAKGGKVAVATIDRGAITGVYTQTIVESADPSVAGMELKPAPFLSVAIAETSGEFIVAGGNSVYQSSLAGMKTYTPPVRYDAYNVGAKASKKDGVPVVAENVRWSAVSADGKFFVAVANLDKTGMVMGFNQGTAAPAWRQAIPKNPNGCSVDAAGQLVAVADGFPLRTASSFYLYDRAGTLQWEYPTVNMNWPVAVSPNGKAVAAGGDDGILYCFEP